jgi:prepilin-type N-terminal cleavage/methylation domain-containing protein
VPTELTDFLRKMKIDILMKALLVQKKNQQKGFTLIELLGVILVLAIVLGVVKILTGGQPDSNQIEELATQNLKVFSQSQEFENLKCDDSDSDKDGYADCTASNQEGKLLQLECTYKKDKTPICQQSLHEDLE